MTTITFEIHFHTKRSFSLWPSHFLHDSTTKNDTQISLFFLMFTNSSLSYLSNVCTKISSQSKKHWEVKSRGNIKNVSLTKTNIYIPNISLSRKSIWLSIVRLDECFWFKLLVLKIISRKLIRFQKFFKENFSSW